MSRRRAVMRGGAAAGLALGAALAMAGLRAEEPPSTGAPRVWSENYEFTVDIGGKPAGDARLYNARGRPAILIVIPGAPQAIVIDTGRRQVLTADAAAVSSGEEADQVMLADEAAGGEPQPFTMERDTVVFFLSGHKHRLARRPPLLGDVSSDALIAQIPAYRKGMEDYTPAPQDIVYLKDFPDPVRIEVFFGSWCPHCRVMVPRFLKSIQEAANANLQCVFTGVPSPFSDYPPAKERQVKGIPAFIVFSGDREIGRIGAFASDSSVEHELVKVLYQWKQSRG